MKLLTLPQDEKGNRTPEDQNERWARQCGGSHLFPSQQMINGQNFCRDLGMVVMNGGPSSKTGFTLRSITVYPQSTGKWHNSTEPGLLPLRSLCGLNKIMNVFAM